ncbi:MAG: YciI family protein [Actinomycetota bacterium]
MKYMLALYSDPANEPADGSPEQAKDMERWFAYTNDLVEAGAMLGGEGLQGPETATTVRVREGSTITSDGPFAETKEVLGGFYVIEAPDLDAAIGWAAKIPNVNHGTVEVWPVMEFDGE